MKVIKISKHIGQSTLAAVVLLTFGAAHAAEAPWLQDTDYGLEGAGPFYTECNHNGMMYMIVPLHQTCPFPTPQSREHKDMHPEWYIGKSQSNGDYREYDPRLDECQWGDSPGHME